ncbi:hypothetical protein [Clostridium butyricum]|uniref:hypothetical protein n=1 Tax=Clostridium butyricum TaxID=1492 RepID=UPI002102E41E|nr:hypothetical protein [Clostridium butyricum]MCQ2012330.1 hypothetical protein [Clostridium butyricum]MCQ2024697.1 hypothetical protein [Clostridium butyricum]
MDYSVISAFVAGATGAVGATGIIVFGIKQSIEKLLNEKVSKSIEKTKGQINKEIEEFKGTIQKDIEKLKIEEGRKDILTTRYVDVVTNQRIMWLDKIRDDISTIISIIKTINFNKECLKQYFETAKIAFICGGKPQISESKNIFEEWMSKWYSLQEETSKLLKVSTRFKLRLNPISDKEIIDLVSEIELVVTSNISENDNERDELNKMLDELVNLSQKMLKDEWEKVKKEVVEGE